MFAEYSETNATLCRVVATVASDRCLQEDLRQEALIHLWQLKNRRPGQSPSWYFKSCQLHLRNLLRKGRSLDSQKRCKGRIHLREPASNDSNESAGLDQLLDNSGPEGPVFAEVCSRDILISMRRWLDPLDRLILDFLADGLSAREVAGRLRLSHTAVIKHQRKIASVALSLGLVPSSPSRATSQKKVSNSGGELLLKREARGRPFCGQVTFTGANRPLGVSTSAPIPKRRAGHMTRGRNGRRSQH